MAGLVSESEQLVALLAETWLFGDFDPQSLVDIAVSFDELEAPEGTLLFREGDVPDCLYVIGSGSVLITKQAEQGPPITLALVERGTVMGVHLLSDVPYTGTGITKTQTQLYRLDREAIQELPDQWSKLRQKIMRIREEFPAS